MIFEYSLNTQKQGFYNITSFVKDAVSKSNIESGVCVVYCPHTTAAITINENTDKDVENDILLGLQESFYNRDSFKHFEGNSDAHLKSSVIGVSETVIINNNSPVLGRWQDIYFCEFDGPRTRQFYVKII
ncbi:secondary thiamine-phosphate synthase enzyme YjbQ [uncultured Tyzzerella sp.]|uniref:secondary thiamine-phosphate synthase enzyme YjbQ n=1 Tax=uncultured Tyzzerella sp. TaxID=2321398 RepID=UPI002943C24D|nr:secondary thiamine-phosphate synthase enzyme YjbQ [uncultured Tyzzerella sp.]